MRLRTVALAQLGAALLLSCSTPSAGGGGGGGRWRAPFRHEWSSLERQSFDFGNNPTGFDDSHELALKARYSVVFLDAGTGTGGKSIGYGRNCCNSSLPGGGPDCKSDCDYVKLVSEQASALKAVSNATSAWIYTSAFCTSTVFNSLSRIVDDPAFSGARQRSRHFLINIEHLAFAKTGGGLLRDEAVAN
jgi:hypothetical protein